ncbi:hypothetical protein G6O69_38815 [Pseudenhygromyxa sp. WMMC2535]|uniref:YncE family protein n=1 Tax=Pseudenhygromyxa sp. WMMC2535 TaxID=2712867 RepID=UPI001595608A|nr:hypothetical protein [Pseudenhygromyxa sp. WMMC2535]NVB43812.1 hypothetical protein [Pseudenhygromyxa sp. WMMC2535]
MLGGDRSRCPSRRSDAIFVVLREEGTVARIVGLDTGPTLENKVTVGAEPGRAALSAAGTTLWVPLWAEGYVIAVDTESMQITQEIETGGSPYAVCVTNDLDAEEGDETVFVTDFYGVAAGGREATDNAREGRVFTITGEGELGELRLPALTSSGTAGFESTGAYPNQLYSCAINKGTLYVSSVGASPASFEGGTDFHQNLQGLVHRVDVESLTPESQPIDLNGLVDELDAPKRFIPIPTDIAFADNTEFAYFSSLSSDSVLRVDFSANPIKAGSLSRGQLPGREPLAHGRGDLEHQHVHGQRGRAQHLPHRPGRAGDRDRRHQLGELTERRRGHRGPPGPALLQHRPGSVVGQRLGELRWLPPLWDHRQRDLVLPRGPAPDRGHLGELQRRRDRAADLELDAIFDEIHDFELNTRGVAGGTGAIVSDTALNDNGSPNAEVRIDIVGEGGVADPINAFNRGSARGAALTGATPDDWDAIETYIASLRSPKAPTRLDGDPLAGRTVFDDGGCDNCHSGSLWTISRRSYTPPSTPTTAATSTSAR